MNVVQKFTLILIISTFTIAINVLGFNNFVPNTASFHEVVQIETGIVRVQVLSRSSRMGVLHAVCVHAYLEGLHVGADGSVRCPRNRVVCRVVQAV